MLRGRIALLSLVVTSVAMAVVIGATRGRNVVSMSPSGSGSTLRISLPADKCVTCHQRETPSIVEQWSRSTHAAKQVTCGECHETAKTADGAKEHYGTYVSPAITSATCQRCHPEEVKEFNRSRHGLPSWTALVGYEGLSAGHKKLFDAIEEVRHDPRGGEIPSGFVGATRNALFHMEGDAVAQMTCVGCHQIGRPNTDGSVGNCTACHLRHEYSLEQARKPETCNHCHIGPDHPQWEIYEESSHGILYHTKGHEWNWKQRPGRLSVADFPAPTCQVCHMSGFGRQGTTHDVGDRLSWYLFAEISTKRPAWSENRQRMREVCGACHSPKFIEEEYRKGDAFTEAVNTFVGEAKKINDGLIADGLMSDAPFDTPFKFRAYDLWHFYGRTAKFGAWMQGPDYSQWHGYYPMLREMSEIKEMAGQMRAGKAGAKRADNGAR